MTEKFERSEPLPAPRFADFGLTEGIHFPAPADTRRVSGDGAAPPAVKPADAPAAASAPEGAAAPTPAESGHPRHGVVAPEITGSGATAPDAGVKPALPHPTETDSSSSPGSGKKPAATGSEENVPVVPAGGLKPVLSTPTETGSPSAPDRGTRPAASDSADNGTPAADTGTKPALPNPTETASSHAPDNGTKPAVTGGENVPVVSEGGTKPVLASLINTPEAAARPRGSADPHNPEQIPTISETAAKAAPAAAPPAPAESGTKASSAHSTPSIDVTPGSSVPSSVAPHAASPDTSPEIPRVRPLSPGSESLSPTAGEEHPTGLKKPENTSASSVPSLAGSLPPIGNDPMKVREGAKPSDTTRGTAKATGDTAESGSSLNLPVSLPPIRPLTDLSQGNPTSTTDKAVPPDTNRPTRTDALNTLRSASLGSTLEQITGQSGEQTPLPLPTTRHADPLPLNADAGKGKDLALKGSMEGLLSPPAPVQNTEVKPTAKNTTDDVTRGSASPIPTLDVGTLPPISRRSDVVAPAPAPAIELPRIDPLNSLNSGSAENNKKGTKTIDGAIGEMLGSFTVSDDASPRPRPANAHGTGAAPDIVLPPAVPLPVVSLPVVPARPPDKNQKDAPGDILDAAANLFNGSRKSLTDQLSGSPSLVEAPRPNPSPLHEEPRPLPLVSPTSPGTLTDISQTTRPLARNIQDSIFGAPPPTPEKATTVKTVVESAAPQDLGLSRPLPVASPVHPVSPETNGTLQVVMGNIVETQARRTVDTVSQVLLTPKEPPVVLPSVQPKSIGDVAGLPIALAQTIPSANLMTNLGVIPNATSDDQRPQRLGPVAAQLVTSSADGLLKKTGAPVDNGDPARRPAATTNDGAGILSGLSSLNNKVEDTPAPTSRTERAPLDLTGTPAPMAPKSEKDRDVEGERQRAAGGVATSVAETAKPVPVVQPSFKPSSLDRNAAAEQDMVSKVVSLDAAKPAGSAADAKSVYSLDSLKSSIIGLNGKNGSIDVSSAKSVELNAKFALAGSEAIKTAAIDVLPLGVKRLNVADDSTIKTAGKLGTLDGVKLDSISINGLKTSLINFVSGRPLTAGDKGTAVKAEFAPVKIEIPTAGINTGVFINGATFNTSHGLAGAIKIDVAGIGKEGPIAISGKVDGTAAGAKTDAIAGVKDGSIAIIQVTSTGKFINVDITSTVKTDGTVTTANTGSVSINGATIQPTATSIKGDAGKVDGAGRPIDGVKGQPCDSAVGTVRGTVLTPGIVNAIANAIRFGYPIPEGITLENGQFAVTYGNEVLYFPGLRAALKFAEVVGLIDAESEKVEEDKDESLQKPGVGANVRVRYTVKEGETLQSIAESELGDVRLSDLIMTINRSEILYRLTEEGKVPFVYPGQLILLPSEQELNIYRKNFFGKKGTKDGAMSGVSSAEVTVEDESRDSGRQVRKALHDEYIASNVAKQPARPKTTVRDMPRFQLGFENIAPAITQEDEWQDYTDTVVNPSVKTEEHQTTDNFAPSEQIAPVSERNACAGAVVLSATGEQAVFLHASVDGAERDTVIVRAEAEPAIVMERLLDVRALSSGMRALVTDLPTNPSQFFIRLEARINEQWTVIASYDGCGDSTSRVRFAENGTKNSMRVNLPEHAVKAMAIEDFVRNWSTYKANYESNNIGRIQVDSVQPMPISLRGFAVSK